VATVNIDRKKERDGKRKIWKRERERKEGNKRREK
jgi:hypothetical protein